MLKKMIDLFTLLSCNFSLFRKKIITTKIRPNLTNPKWNCSLPKKLIVESDTVFINGINNKK